MFSAKEKELIKSVYGQKYATPLVAHLTRKGIFNAHGEPFSNTSIVNLFTAGRTNTVVEMEILREAKREKIRRAALAKERKEIIRK